MRIHTTMPKGLRPFYRKELAEAALHFRMNDLATSWHHLERAHIIGQPYPYEHTLAHWHMLRFGIATKNTREIIGQLPRLVVGGVKSFVGHIPVGNTGGANVHPLKPMEIPQDLTLILNNNSK
jgi:hypothetical protein